MRIAIASDHAGYDLKKGLIRSLKTSRVDLSDLGTHNTKHVDYPDYAEKLGLAVQKGLFSRGILICGSGVGVSIAANKIPGVRAAICHDPYSAHQGVEHDDMNVLVLGAWVVSIKLAEELVEKFLNARFSAEARQVRRLRKVAALETRCCGISK